MLKMETFKRRLGLSGHRFHLTCERSTSLDGVGPSVPPNAAPSLSSTIPDDNFGSSPRLRNHPKTAGPTCSGNSLSDPVSFCSHTKSHFELPPTGHLILLGPGG
jgi:hypothetical protein